jgi:hypothetical protein
LGRSNVNTASELQCLHFFHQSAGKILQHAFMDKYPIGALLFQVETH